MMFDGEVKNVRNLDSFHDHKGVKEQAPYVLTTTITAFGPHYRLFKLFDISNGL